MRVVVVGTGYVGLVTGSCLAEVGNRVTCVDVDRQRVQLLRNRVVPFHEPGLEELVRRNVEEGRLWFATDLADCLPGAQVCLITVGTPSNDDGSCDTSQVLEVARQIGRHLEGYLVVAVKSTVPVGTCEAVEEAIRAELERRGGGEREFSVVSNPEFLKEGGAVADFMKPDRIVVGSDDARAIELLHQLYAPFCRSREKFVVMDRRSAELTKYAANVMLAARISLMNEIAAICERTGADVEAVRKGVGSDPRIGPYFIYAGCGYGGSCFPKDLRALKRVARDLGIEPHMLEAIERVNERQKLLLAEKVRGFFGSLAGRRLGIWGLAFKPNTDDVREAPSLALIAELVRGGAELRLYDPRAMSRAREALALQLGEGVRKLRFVGDQYEAARDADALLVVTEWMQFRHPDFALLREIMRRPVIFDGRNLYDPQLMRSLGFTYFGIGRGSPPGGGRPSA